ncbi:MAG: hypothetical protein L0211_23445 [Planctomycetaceae bacterium]|nr:hypothetical protein [Planctomycetaceae bacterium]
MDEIVSDGTPSRRRTAKAREPFSRQLILELDAALMQAFSAIRELRIQSAVAAMIQYPPLPASFTESIVVAAAKTLFGEGWIASYGGSSSDIVLVNSSGQRRRVEVKASGRNAFQELKAKDLRADVLVWVRFGRRYELGAGPIAISVLENPGQLIHHPCRLDFARFERIEGVVAQQKLYSFSSLEELLNENRPRR